MTKTLFAISLLSLSISGSIQIPVLDPELLVPYEPDVTQTFELEETTFGPYIEGWVPEEFTVNLITGSAYANKTYECYARVFLVNDYTGTYEEYVDYADMGTTTIKIGGSSDDSLTTKTPATFKVSFFKAGYPLYGANPDVILGFYFKEVNTILTPGQASGEEQLDNITAFYSRAVMRGYGIYEVDSSDSAFEPYDDYFVFGSSNQTGNITETIDFTNTADAICEESYCKLSERFGFSYIAKDVAHVEKTDDIEGHLYVYDPKYCFKYMHSGLNYFELTLKASLSGGSGVDKTGKTPQTQSASFAIGGTTYWAHPHTLEMCTYQLTPDYIATQNFYFPAGCYEDIKDNVEFYFVATNVGYNEATYYVNLDFLASHDYLGNCNNSTYCISGGRGGH